MESGADSTRARRLHGVLAGLQAWRRWDLLRGRCAAPQEDLGFQISCPSEPAPGSHSPWRDPGLARLGDSTCKVYDSHVPSVPLQKELEDTVGTLQRCAPVRLRPLREASETRPGKRAAELDQQEGRDGHERERMCGWSTNPT